MPAYAKVIAGNQQVRLLPVNMTGLDRRCRFYAHGYHLPAGTIVGSTRFRIPMLVRIWNYVLTGINIVARVERFEGQMDVFATASHSSGELNQTFLHLGGLQKDDWIHLCFTTTGVKKVFYTMMNLVGSPFRKVRVFIQNIPELPVRILKLLIPEPRKADYRHIVRADVQETKLRGLNRFLADLSDPKLERTMRTNASVAKPKLEKTAKGTAQTGDPLVLRTGKMKATTMGTANNRMFKLTAKLLGISLTGIMSHIKYDLLIQKVQQVFGLHTSAVLYENSKSSKVTAKTFHSYRKISVLTEATQWISGKMAHFFHLMSSKAKALLGLQLYHSRKQSILSIDMSTMQIERRMDLLSRLEEFRGKLLLFVHVEEIRDHIIELQAYILSLLGDTKIQFRPSTLPQVRSLNVMVSVCQTWLLSYLSFVPQEVIRGLDVHVSTCSHTIRHILQWYMVGGRISNQGYGNEVIFDLGQVEPIGPIPPVPSQKWEGGYVEDPFKGVGYVPKDDTTGYASPKVEEWLGNVKMYWDEASQPFEGGKEGQP